MAIIVDGENLNVPFFVDDYGEVDISVTDFDPVTTLRDWKYVATDMHASRLGNYLKKGFLIRPSATGVIFAITLRQFKEAIKHPVGQNDATILAGLVPEQISVNVNQWLECRLIKVFGADSSPELSDEVVETIDVGWLL